ncbi:GTP-binding protein, partial [Patescibacteria group bacterium]|nr:GTP-binding protein [Patescibacteria group bacterium]
MRNQKESKFKIVFVGHVDHGKSTLIGRLLCDTKSITEEKISEVKTICKQQGKQFEYAYLMDHMIEERDQNITIDTAQIFFKTDAREYVIIDAPGHVEFTKNMITGASQAEAAILIVDANEGIQEQTKRHAKFLSLLGLEQVIVVINKMDKVKYKEENYIKVKKELLEFLKKIKITPTFIIPISAFKGDNIAKKSDNMDWYEDKTVLEALETFKETKNLSNKPFRMPIQDLYKFDEIRIIAGQIASGTIKKGDEVTFLPKGNKSSIKTIEKMNQQLESASAGENIGITLIDPIFVDRGDIATQSDNKPKSTDEVVGNLFWMSKEPLSIKENLTLQCATQEIGVFAESITNRINSSSLKIIEDKSNELKEMEIATVKLKADNPVIIEDFNNIPE